MKVIETKIVPEKIIPEHPRESLKHILCDVCKINTRDSKYGDWDDPSDSFSNTCETTVEYKVGNAWPEGGSGDLVTLDICPECFLNILVPFLEEKGAEVRTEEWDF